MAGPAPARKELALVSMQGVNKNVLIVSLTAHPARGDKPRTEPVGPRSLTVILLTRQVAQPLQLVQFRNV